MRIAIAQMKVRAGLPQDNFERMRALTKQALANNSEVIFFPEMCLPGYLLGDTWERPEFCHECEALGHEVAKLSSLGIAIIFGNVGMDWSNKGEDGRPRKYNAAFVAVQGKLLINPATGFSFWPKTLLPNYREFEDTRHFFDLRRLALERGVKVESLLAPVSLPSESGMIEIGLGICEDGWREDYGTSPFDILAQKNELSFFVNLSCSPYSAGKREKREKILGNLCKDLKKPLLYVNAVGSQNVGKTIFGFDGSSEIFLPSESVYWRAKFFQEDLGCFEINQAGTILPLKNQFPAVRKILSSDEERYLALTSILKECLTEWGITRVVIGASGGIDSALAAALYERVLGNKNVILVNMPTRFNSQLTKNAAKDLAHRLGCSFATIPIEDSVHLTLDQLNALEFDPPVANFKVTTLVQENIQARDRSSRVLASVAASLGGVFTCNANKSELSVGYCTLYGDEGGFVAALADLWKHQVYALARYMNEEIYGKEVIPEASLLVVPSAELSFEQDVNQNKGDPFVYPYHDFLFASWIEHWSRKTPFDCLKAYLAGELDQLIGCEVGLTQRLFPSASEFVKDLERWWKLYVGMGAVKRVQAPPVIALSRRTFGWDHREVVPGKIWMGNNYEELKRQHHICQ